MRLIAIFIVLISTIHLALGQNKITPESVIKKYIDAIGGKKKLQKVKTLQQSYSQMVNGEKHQLVEKKAADQSYSFSRHLSKGSMKAIMSNNEGVNITEEGTFYMSDNQVYRNIELSKLFPELDYLQKGYSLTYNGIYELDAQTKCHEVSIKSPDNKVIYKEYNIETGLLELIVYQKDETRILEYNETNGILFPKRYTYNGRLFETDTTIINPTFSKEEFKWNSPKELAVIGRWEAKGITNEKGQQQISFLELNTNRSGKMGIGLSVNEKLEEVGFLTFYFAGWEFEGESIKLNEYNPVKKELHTQFLIINKIEKDKIIGYISNPEIEKELNLNSKPALLEFIKINSN